MLKRKIAVLIAGGLLGAQVTLAAADQTAYFPSNDTEVIWKLFPAQVKYLEEREASIKKAPAVPTVYSEEYYQRYYVPRTSLMSSSPGAAIRAVPSVSSTPPGLHKYLYVTRVAELQKEEREQAARGDVYKMIKVDASIQSVTVEHLGTVKIVNDKGQSFVWTCDAPGEHIVPLKAIAPAGFEAGNTTIYVRHPAAHIPG